MKIAAWRIVKAKHAADAFSGEGGRLFGGRWNSPGTAVVYTAGSAALAMLEMLVHLKSHELLNRYVLFEAAFDESLVQAIDPRRLPRLWRKSTATLAARRIGDDWAADRTSAVLRLPSVIVPNEWTIC